MYKVRASISSLETLAIDKENITMMTDRNFRCGAIDIIDRSPCHLPRATDVAMPCYISAMLTYYQQRGTEPDYELLSRKYERSILECGVLARSIYSIPASRESLAKYIDNITWTEGTTAPQIE